MTKTTTETATKRYFEICAETDVGEDLSLVTVATSQEDAICAWYENYSEEDPEDGCAIVWADWREGGLQVLHQPAADDTPLGDVDWGDTSFHPGKWERGDSFHGASGRAAVQAIVDAANS